MDFAQKSNFATEPLAAPKRVQVHSVGGDLGINDADLRQALHQRHILTVGIPTTIEPIHPTPSPEEVLDILNTSGLHRIRTPYHVHLACASGYSRPVVESHIATLMARGAGHVPYKGLDGAVLVRIRQQRLSKRGQKFRRLLGFNRYKFNEINVPKI